MTNDEMLSGLVGNALDFLRRASEDFTEHPKFSVINFYAAVELMLKARLLAEHWAQVVDKHTTRRKFEEGDFTSVTFAQAVERLRDVVGTPINEDAIRSFDAVRRHRNKMVHFFQSAGSKLDLDKTAAEQLRAWYHLNQLLTTTWRDVFAPYETDIKALERSLHTQRDYLRAKFDALTPQINILRKKGKGIADCEACLFEAAAIRDLADGLFESTCLVCGAKRKWLVVQCEQCDAVNDFEGGGESIHCSTCDTVEEVDSLVERLNEECHRPDEASLAITPANCRECEGYHTVIEHNGQYLCLQCLDANDTLEQCEWCSEHSSGDMSDSYLLGCGICEGHAGWHGDDD